MFMGLFDWLFSRKTKTTGSIMTLNLASASAPSSSPPNQQQLQKSSYEPGSWQERNLSSNPPRNAAESSAERQGGGDSGAGLLIDVLSQAESFGHTEPPRQYQDRLSIAIKSLSRSRLPPEEAARIVSSLLKTSMVYKNYGRFPLWYQSVLASCPRGVVEAMIQAAEAKKIPDSVDWNILFDTIRSIGGGQADAFFQRRREAEISRKKGQNEYAWRSLADKLLQLRQLSLPEAQAYLERVAAVKGIVEWSPNITGWGGNTAARAFTVDDAIDYALQAGSSYNLDYAHEQGPGAGPFG
jgi:hypothetical protein